MKATLLILSLISMACYAQDKKSASANCFARIVSDTAKVDTATIFLKVPAKLMLK